MINVKTLEACTGGLCVCISVLLSLACGARGEGNAILYGGGDPVYQRLEIARLVFAASMGQVQRGVDADTLCQEKGLQFFNDAQRSLCREFILSKKDELLAFAKRNLESLIAVIPGTLTLPDVLGTRLPITAKTPLGPKGKIELSFDRVQHMSVLDLVEVLGHELGHKVLVQGRYVDDSLPFGEFTQPGGGRSLLNLVGLSIRLYANKHHPYFSDSTLSEIIQTKMNAVPDEEHFLPKIVNARLYPIKILGKTDAKSEVYLAKDLRQARPKVGSWLIRLVTPRHDQKASATPHSSGLPSRPCLQ